MWDLGHEAIRCLREEEYSRQDMTVGVYMILSVAWPCGSPNPQEGDLTHKMFRVNDEIIASQIIKGYRLQRGVLI